MFRRMQHPAERPLRQADSERAGRAGRLQHGIVEALVGSAPFRRTEAVPRHLTQGVCHPRDMLDAAISAWSSSLPIDDVLQALEQAEVPAGRIYSVADIVADPHYQARQMILDTELPGGAAVKMPGIVPKLSETPGGVNWQGPTLGEHTASVLASLGLTAQDIQRLTDEGVVQ